VALRPALHSGSASGVIIESTGSVDVITAAHVAAMRDGAILANAGHFDVEIDVRALTGLATEWQSPDFHDSWLRLFEVEAILLVVSWVLSGRRDVFGMTVAALAFAAALQAQRNVSLFALAAAPQLAICAADAWAAHHGVLSRAYSRHRRSRVKQSTHLVLVKRAYLPSPTGDTLHAAVCHAITLR